MQSIKPWIFFSAQKLSLVGPLEGSTTPSYSGFLTVDPKYDSNLFFWFYPAQVTKHFLFYVTQQLHSSTFVWNHVRWVDAWTLQVLQGKIHVLLLERPNAFQIIWKCQSRTLHSRTQTARGLAWFYTKMEKWNCFPVGFCLGSVHNLWLGGWRNWPASPIKF